MYRPSVMYRRLSSRATENAALLLLGRGREADRPKTRRRRPRGPGLDEPGPRTSTTGRRGRRRRGRAGPVAAAGARVGAVAPVALVRRGRRELRLLPRLDGARGPRERGVDLLVRRLERL